MTQPSRVIYLPPGVAAPAAATPLPQAGPSGLPFDRHFFEQVLPQSVASFSAAANCGTPIVELLTVDGITHYVKGISGVSDVWVALHTTQPDHSHPIQVFVPYQTIFRLAIHPCDDERPTFGFALDQDRPIPAPAPAAAPAPVTPGAAPVKTPAP